MQEGGGEGGVTTCDQQPHGGRGQTWSSRDEAPSARLMRCDCSIASTARLYSESSMQMESKQPALEISGFSKSTRMMLLSSSAPPRSGRLVSLAHVT
jgi:hypothetical protein